RGCGIPRPARCPTRNHVAHAREALGKTPSRADRPCACSGAGPRTGIGAITVNTKSPSSAENHQMPAPFPLSDSQRHQKAQPQREPDPVVVAEGLQAVRAAAVADKPQLPDEKGDGGGEADPPGPAEMGTMADEDQGQDH